MKNVSIRLDHLKVHLKGGASKSNKQNKLTIFNWYGSTSIRLHNILKIAFSKVFVNRLPPEPSEREK